MDKQTKQENDEVIRQALGIVRRRFKRANLVSSPETARQYLRLHYSQYEREAFTVTFLDNRHKVIASEDMFFGTIDGASVYPREVVKRSLQHNAAAVLLSHNHPSGVCEPSQADHRITQRLKDALALVDIRIIDHLVVGEDTYSFAEKGDL